MTPLLRVLRRRVGHTLGAVERYLKTDLKYLLSGGFWLAVDEVIGGLAIFLLAIAFANYLPKDVYGTYRFLIAGFWILTAFSLTGLPTAVSRAVARGHEGVYRGAFLYSARWGLPLFLISLCVSGYYFFNENTLLGYGFLVIAALGPFVQAAYLWGTFFSGTKRFRALAIGGSVFAAIPALALFVTMLISPTPLALLATYLGATVLTGLGLTAWVIWYYQPNRVADDEYRHTSKHFSAMNLLSTVAAQIDKLVVFHYLGAVELAVYALAIAIPDQIKNLFAGVATLAFPKFVQRSLHEVLRNYWRRLWIYTALLSLIALAYAFIAPYVYQIFFPAYKEAIWYSMLYALALIPTGASLSVALLQAHKAHRELYILNISSPIIQIGSLVVLTALYGLTGAIAARVIGRAAAFLIGNALLSVYASRVPEHAAKS